MYRSSSKMYRLFFIVVFLAVGSPSIFAQNQLEPTPNKALLTFKFYNPSNEEPWQGLEVEISGQKTGQRLRKTSNPQGEVKVLLPVQDVYSLHLENLPNFGSIAVGEGAYQKHHIPIPYDGQKVQKNTIANENELVVRLILEKKGGQPNPMVEKIHLYDEVHQQHYEVQTNKEGRAAIRLPRDGRYVVSFKDAPQYYRFSPPELKYDIWEERILFERKTGYALFPNTTHGLINFRYIDMQNQAVANERFEVENKATGEKFYCTTNRWGIAQVLLPLGHRYLFSTEYNPHFEQMEVALEENYDIFEFEVLYQSPSSEEWAKRIAEIEALSALRDSMARLAITQKLDAPTPKPEKDELEPLMDFKQTIPIKNLKTFKVRKATERKAKRYQDSLAQNPNLFQEKQKPVLATLGRLQGQWKHKVIVTDVTQSMAPYMEEVLIWHALNLIKGAQCKYIFFNDGDNKIATEKHIGATGGIYSCVGSLKDFDQIITKMKEAAAPRMGGGDPPENDIEALLAGIAQKDSLDEIILIADAHSRIRDMKLLIKVEVPVRIILCGAEEKNNFYIRQSDLNEQYLTIAHRTGGSIHTLSEDIWDLSHKSDGDVIELQGIRYLLKNHQFIRL